MHKELTITARELAGLLALDLGGEEKVWEYRLAGWRRASRKTAAPLPHTSTEAGGVIYRMQDVMAFIGKWQAKELALATAAPTETSTRFSVTAATSDPGRHVVRLVLADGALRVACDLTQHGARRLAATLLAVADEVGDAILDAAQRAGGAAA